MKVLLLFLSTILLSVIYVSEIEADVCGDGWFCGVDEGYSATVEENAKKCAWNGYNYYCDNDGEWACNRTAGCTLGCASGTLSPCLSCGNLSACQMTVSSTSFCISRCYLACDLSDGKCTLTDNSATTGCCVKDTCVEDCSCAATTCVGQTCDDGCGGTCNGTLTSSCTISTSVPVFNGVGDVNTTATSIIEKCSWVTGITYSVADTSIANIISTSYPTANIQSQAIGSTTYTATATMYSGETCSGTGVIDVAVPIDWFQVLGGDAVTGDKTVVSSISCQVPADPPGLYLMEDIVVNSPGLPMASGTISAGSGAISSKGWTAANSPFLATIPSYSDLRDKGPSIIVSLGSSVGQTNLEGTNGTLYPSGSSYYYFEYDGTFGDLSLGTLGGTIDLGNKKVIVFANSNVNINSKIVVNNGNGLFMLIAGGNININPSVGGNDDTDPDLEGVYFTDLNFTSGTLGLNMGLDSQLHVRGVVVAGNIVQMQRSPAYADIPGDLFEFGADQNMLIPPALSRKEMTWKEVLP